MTVDKADASAGPPSVVGWKILVAEDEPLIALDLKASLEEVGCFVIGPVSTVAGAVRMLDTDEPDVALLDFQLTDGAVTPLALALQEKAVPFLVMTGYGSAEALGPSLIAAPRIEKPFEFSSLMDLIGRLR